MNPELERRVLAAPKFVTGRNQAKLVTILDAMPAIKLVEEFEEPDWNYLLTAASFLIDSRREESQNATLEVAQACLISEEAEEHQRAAALVLLERLGNRPAVLLAEDRDDSNVDAWLAEPAAALNVVKTRLELSVPSLVGPSFNVNRFQREFWTAAQNNNWLSVSAPTAAGKSYIVRRWIQEQLTAADELRCVYLVPTRALIEEVGHGLERQLGDVAGVRTLPWDDEIGRSPREVFVFTQERLHLLLQKEPELAIDLIFVDEAQKFGDDSRGVLLQQVLDEVVLRSGDCQVVFASALSENPQVLLEGSPVGIDSDTLVGQTVTVTQNLLWVNQVPQKPTLWDIEIVDGEGSKKIGSVELQARPQPPSKRLSLVAVALGQNASSNVVYVNTPSDAEKTASQIFEALGEGADISDEPRIQALRELCQKTIHENYALGEVIRRGVGFHYGNIPLLVRTEVEKLFRDGLLRYLVCTSTLLEGVNFPCQSLFVLGVC